MPDAEIIYIGQKFDVSYSKMVKNNQNIDHAYSVFAGKLRRYNGKKISWYITQPKLLLLNTRDLFYLLFGIIEAFIIMLFNRPRVIFVKGGYVGLPVGLAGVVLRIPIVTHDSDTHPGLTNRILSKYATKIGVGQPIINYPKYPISKLVYCGVPIKDIYINPPAINFSRSELGINKNEKVIAVVGGSLGAVRINKAVKSDLHNIAKKNRLVYWLSGYHHFKELNDYVSSCNFDGRVIIEPFVHNPETILNSADVVVSRTGATFLAELSALKKATILIPNPLLTGGHQLKNALVYEQNRASIVIQESELSKKPQLLAESIDKILSDSSLKQQLQSNIAKFAVLDSAQTIARLVLNVGFRQ